MRMDSFVRIVPSMARMPHDRSYERFALVEVLRTQRRVGAAFDDQVSTERAVVVNVAGIFEESAEFEVWRKVF